MPEVSFVRAAAGALGRIVSVALALGVTSGAAFAQVPKNLDLVLLDCTFDSGSARGGNWIPERVFIFRVKDSEDTLVYDPIIKELINQPIRARKGDETKVRVTYSWEVVAKDKRNQSSRLFYRLTYYRDGKPASMTMQPGGYDNSFSGSGTCKAGKS
jgi:hypothetical protein